MARLDMPLTSGWPSYPGTPTLSSLVCNVSLRELRWPAWICPVLPCRFVLPWQASPTALTTTPSTCHPRFTQALKEVDGLKNEEVVVVITSTGKKNGVYLRDRIIPSRCRLRALCSL